MKAPVKAVKALSLLALLFPLTISLLGCAADKPVAVLDKSYCVRVKVYRPTEAQFAGLKKDPDTWWSMFQATAENNDEITKGCK